MGASDTLRRMKPISTEPTVRRAPRWPRLPAASKNHRVLSSSQAQLANRCAVQGQGIGTTLGPSGSNIREARSQLPALGDGVRAKWEPDCRDGTCVYVPEWRLQQAAQRMAARSSAPQMASPRLPGKEQRIKGQGASRGIGGEFPRHPFNTSLSSAPFRAVFWFYTHHLGELLMAN
ncbi:uncharacterized protein LOC116073145 [Mastomys coucha]|uniref:uncharacterized protein LOC116073145 n=1 Tax=Mastomys coucha TaxID=35658 RepID=UPI001261BC0C|nr:uncharacterized protein LOC116073145 [Mastomys coucha]